MGMASPGSVLAACFAALAVLPAVSGAGVSRTFIDATPEAYLSFYNDSTGNGLGLVDPSNPYYGDCLSTYGASTSTARDGSRFYYEGGRITSNGGFGTQLSPSVPFVPLPPPASDCFGFSQPNSQVLNIPATYTEAGNTVRLDAILCWDRSSFCYPDLSTANWDLYVCPFEDTFFTEPWANPAIPLVNPFIGSARAAYCTVSPAGYDVTWDSGLDVVEPGPDSIARQDIGGYHVAAWNDGYPTTRVVSWWPIWLDRIHAFGSGDAYVVSCFTVNVAEFDPVTFDFLGWHTESSHDWFLSLDAGSASIQTAAHAAAHLTPSQAYPWAFNRMPDLWGENGCPFPDATTPPPPPY